MPNWLTYLRLALVPLLVILLIDPSDWMSKAAAVVFCLAAITDFFDGFIARKFGGVSDFGKLMDPLVDKLLVVSALIMLASLRLEESGRSWVPGWLVVLIVGREVWVTGLRGVAATKGAVVAAGVSGKLKAALQMLAIVLLLLHDSTIQILDVEVVCHTLGLDLLILSLIFSYIGAYEYTMTIMGDMKEPSSETEPLDRPLPQADDSKEVMNR